MGLVAHRNRFSFSGSCRSTLLLFVVATWSLVATAVDNPQSPEFASFGPAGQTEPVDLFDFRYAISNCKISIGEEALDDCTDGLHALSEVDLVCFYRLKQCCIASVRLRRFESMSSTDGRITMARQINRRRFIREGAAATSIAVFSQPWLGSVALADYAVAPAKRRAASGLKASHPILVGYGKAIAAMKALPATNPCSWAAQAAIHCARLRSGGAMRAWKHVLVMASHVPVLVRADHPPQVRHVRLVAALLGLRLGGPQPCVDRDATANPGSLSRNDKPALRWEPQFRIERRRLAGDRDYGHGYRTHAHFVHDRSKLVSTERRTASCTSQSAATWALSPPLDSTLSFGFTTARSIGCGISGSPRAAGEAIPWAMRRGKTRNLRFMTSVARRWR